MPSGKGIADANAAAVALLQHGQYKRAVRKLRGALFDIRSNLERDNKLQRGVPSSSSSSCPSRTGCSTLRVKVGGEASSSSGDSTASQESSFLKYNRAFVLSVEDESTSSNLVCENALTPIVLYNLGLAYHSLAVETGTSSLFQNALQLYQASFEIVQDTSNNFPDLPLALVSNMGHIHSFFFNWNEMTHCQGQMQSILYSNVDLFDIFDDDEDYNFFVAALVSSQHRLVLAPAA